MTLRKRLLWLFTPLLALTLVFAYGLSERILLSRFDVQDRVLLLNDVEPLRSRLDTLVTRNLDLLKTYSEWDDSYEFMQGKYPDFVRSNMDEQSLALLGFDFMIYLDLKGQVVTEQWQPPELEQMLSVGSLRPSSYESLRSDILQLGKQLAQQSTAEQNLDGRGQLLMLQGTPLLLVASPITDSQSYSAPIGILIAGHFIDAERFSSLQNQVDGKLLLTDPASETLHWDSLVMPPDSSLDGLKIGPRRLLDNQQQQLDLQFSNQLNQPELALRINEGRRLRQEGQQAIWFFLLLTVTVGVLALLLIYLSLEFWVLRRLQRIHREVTLIGANSQLPRLTDQGNDELGQLAHALNNMFERLSQSESREQLILDSINEGYFEVDTSGKLISANDALANIFGYNRTELHGRNFKQVLNEDDTLRTQTLLQQLAQGSSENILAAQFKRRDGSFGHFEARLAAMHDHLGHIIGWRGIVRDTSEQMAYQNQLIDMAYRDPLTGLGNRKAFGEQLQSCLEHMQHRQQTLALLYLDLDHFKEVNDQFGHDIGDLLLQTIAERLRNSLRQPDWAYRLGGDEFTVLLPEADQPAALKLAERLISRLSQPFKHGDVLIDFVTPSIGIAIYPEHAKYAEGLIKAADIAMYEAKEQRNRACIYQPAKLSSPE
ncbi:MAG: diguanylate cyclase [Pseudomonas sp.]|uniref:sensor domain-containing diguanylate cyclase n=1 Tax=Pseudomonas sp. TaxID=306 RepID=UPI0027337243|nr:diguanylate cyclase [Pseudomonas sp.]MDP3846490.1 diguanylate cyclase [Pseudomonas sp.]